MQRKKLQIFISSTYVDLRLERQAAVEAILTAGHIPAGMELFAAGDQSQLQTIRQWIDESDVFLLILGGRYGSIDPDSGKSYIQLEYEYALSRGKPLFSVVITDKHLKEKTKRAEDPNDIIEREHFAEWKAFRENVLTRLVRFWHDPRDIKLAVLETLGEFSRRDQLVGWIPGDQVVNAVALAEEIARLTKENASLREQLSRAGDLDRHFNGLSFGDMYRLLVAETYGLSLLEPHHRQLLQNTAKALQDAAPGLIHFIWLMQQDLLRGGESVKNPLNEWIFGELKAFGLLTGDPIGNQELTTSGRQFLLRLIIEKGTAEARQCLQDYNEMLQSH